MKKTIPPIDRLQAEATDILGESDAGTIRDKLRGFLQYYDAINYRLWYGFPLWRARKCMDSSGFANLADVHYPLPSDTEAGRINERGSPMLYVSLNKFTAFHEIGIQPGEFLQVIGYWIDRDRPLRSLILGEINNVHKRGQGLIPGELSESINTILNKMSFEASLSFVFMDAFLSGIFSDRNSEQRGHIHSRTLSKLLFEKYPDVEAIHYPSVALEGSMNLAIKPVVADEALRVAGTSVVHIERQYNYGLYRFRILRDMRGHSESGVIDWREMS